jgi:hypothetical protein
MEEIFFFMYHLHQSKRDALVIPVYERRWLIDRFVKQKDRENEQIEAAKRQAKIRR